MTERLALRGERVALVQLGPEDAGRVAEYHRRNESHLRPWSPPLPPGMGEATTWRARLLDELAAAEAGTALRMHLVEAADPEGAVIGHASLSQIFRGPFHNAYVGYALAEDAQGRGLMTEALRLLIAHAFGPMGLHRLQANYVTTNGRSARVLARLGFQPEGIAKDYLFIDGRWRDHVMTALLNPEHPGP